MRATGVEQVVRGFTPNWMGEKGGAQSDREEQEDVLGNPAVLGNLLSHFPGHPIPVAVHSSRESVLPHISPEPPLAQLE